MLRNPMLSWSVVVGGLLLATTTAFAQVQVTLLEAPGDRALRFGHSVADAGDVNGDGWPDVVVGVPFDTSAGAEAGRAYLWFGGPEMSLAPDVVLDEGSSGDWFGWAVAGIGDVDDDGYDDFAVGGPGDDSPGEKQGAVWVYFGGPSFAGSPFQKLAGEQGGDRFGWSISAAGDMDRDGNDDFVVGAPYADAPLIDQGRVYLYLGGSSNLSSTADAVWDGPQVGGPLAAADFQEFAPDFQPISGPGFGWSLSDVHDFRGDGRAAVAVGAPGAQGAQGRVYLFAATSTAGTLPSATPLITFTNSTSDEQFGWSVSDGGRISSDARTDLLVGAPGANGDRGYVRVFYGTSSSPAEVSTADFQRTGGTSGDRFGHAVAAAGDVDGNGGDWLVGAPEKDDDGLNAGWVYWFDRTSSSPMDVRAVNRDGSGVADDLWGFDLSTAGGDLDGDGLDDFLVGAPRANTSSGAVRGNVAMVTSGDGVVSAPVVRLQTEAAADGRLDLLFVSTRLTRADAAALWSTDADARLLASLGDGMRIDAEGLRASLDVDWWGRTVALQWSENGIEMRQLFALPTPAARARLLAPAPNPFNPRTRLRFEAPVGVAWQLRVVDLRGRVVREIDRGVGTGTLLERDFLGVDDHGRSLASGSYRVELRAAGRVHSRSVVLIE